MPNLMMKMFSKLNDVDADYKSDERSICVLSIQTILGVTWAISLSLYSIIVFKYKCMIHMMTLKSLKKRLW